MRPRPSSHRPLARAITGIALVAIAGLAGCSRPDANPVSPAPSANAGLVSGLTSLVSQLVGGLLRAQPLPETSPVVTVIGREGGSFQVPGGLTVVVPAGAVREPTTFTATAIPGSTIAYEFGPHGITFNRPIRFEQSLEGTAWNPSTPLRVGYYTKLILGLDGILRGLVTEWQPTAVDPVSGKVIAELRHFSGYMVSSGR